MLRVLVVTGGPHARSSAGWPAVEFLLAQIRGFRPDVEVVQRALSAPDIVLPPAAYADAVVARAAAGDPAFALSETLIGELETCDLLVVATPMHNFTVPAALKAWIDYVLRIGRTFDATPTGKVGRLKDRPTFVLVTSGGFHQGERANQLDFLSGYLSYTLRTVGIDSVNFVYLEGMAYGQEAVALAIAEGIECIRSLMAAVLTSR